MAAAMTAGDFVARPGLVGAALRRAALAGFEEAGYWEPGEAGFEEAGYWEPGEADFAGARYWEPGEADFEGARYWVAVVVCFVAGDPSIYTPIPRLYRILY
ncbi:MAG: hypothetical protein NVS2B12_38080 [Ktedonobacteraceae bacterium]